MRTVIIDLYHKIAENGLIIAESPFGSNPMAQHFPKRNRIIAGISQAVAIIEAAFGSGSLITARMAMEYNKEIFAMPGFPMDPRSKGTNNLIKQGANVLLSAADIIDAYGYEQEVREDIGYLFREPVNHILKNNNYDEAQISDIRVEIQKLLSNHPVGIEEIAVATGYDVVFILTILLELELAGKIQRYNDNKISLIYN